MSVVTSRVEPRLVERRRQVAEAASRRRRRQLWVLCGVLVVIGAASAVMMSPLVDIDRVTVSGNERLDGSALVEATGLHVGSAMSFADLDAARESLLAIPWVESVSVTREWPSTVKVVVTEQTPEFVVTTTANSYLVSSSDRVLEPAASQGSEHPELRVDAGIELEPGERVPDQLSGAMSMLHQMSDGMQARVADVAVASDGDITLQLDDDVEVVLGPAQEVPAKLLATETLLSRVVSDCMQTVDVREPKRPTVSRRDGCDTPPPTSTSTLETPETGH